MIRELSSHTCQSFPPLTATQTTHPPLFHFHPSSQLFPHFHFTTSHPSKPKMSGGVAPTPLPTQNPPLTPRRGLLSFQNLNAAALALILSASGTVAIQDIAFVLISLLYLFFLSKFAFPTLSTTPPPPVFSDHHRLLTVYVSIGALIGLLLPVAYILHGAIEGDQNGIKAAAPHAFLMASQVLMEAVTFSGGFSLPVRVFVPVVYNAVRMYAILDWVKSEVMRGDESGTRLVVGRGLAVANMVFWGFNLFGFLLPVYMPKAFKKYYTDDKDNKDS